MPLVLLGAAMVAAALPLIWWAVSGPRPVRAAVAANLRTSSGTGDLRTALLAHSARDRAVAPAIERLARRARRLSPAGLVDGLERRILLAGAPQGWTLERVLAGKLLLGAAGAVIGVLRFVASPSFFDVILTVVFVAVGWFLADVLLYNRATKRQLQIGLDLPDTLDQVTISVEAGLAFEAALGRSARNGSGPLADEILRMLQDIQAGASRAEAMAALVDRTDVAELRHFVTAVRQGEQYGVPIAHILRVQSAELRVKRRQRAEERAMKIPVKVIFPLVLCILPTMFIVILGPAVISISKNIL